MKRITVKSNAAVLSLLALAIVLGGSCSIKQAYPTKDYFALDISREGEPKNTGDGKTILVRDFVVSPRYEDKGFVYRIGDLTYETDYYNEFVVPPGVLLGGDLREWLSESGLFALVTDMQSSMRPDSILEGRVTELYGDMREKGAEKAVLEIKLFLFENTSPDPTLRFQRTYREEIPLRERSPTALAEGWNEGFREILIALAEDLAKL